MHNSGKKRLSFSRNKLLRTQCFLSHSRLPATFAPLRTSHGRPLVRSEVAGVVLIAPLAALKQAEAVASSAVFRNHVDVLIKISHAENNAPSRLPRNVRCAKNPLCEMSAAHNRAEAEI